MSTPYTYTGALAPDSLVFVVSRAPGGPDLSTVVSANLSVQYPDLTVHTWAASITLQASTSLTLVHSFGAGDTTLIGDYTVFAVMTTGGGTIRSRPRPFSVLPAFQL